MSEDKKKTEKQSPDVTATAPEAGAEPKKGKDRDGTEKIPAPAVKFSKG